MSTNEPITSASTKRQPSSSQSTAPNSTTRLVDANMKASEGIKAAPCAKALRAAAVAAYEQELLAAPKPVASVIERRSVRPKSADIFAFETNTCKAAEIVNPSTSAQKGLPAHQGRVIKSLPITSSSLIPYSPRRADSLSGTR